MPLLYIVSNHPLHLPPPARHPHSYPLPQPPILLSRKEGARLPSICLFLSLVLRMSTTQPRDTAPGLWNKGEDRMPPRKHGCVLWSRVRGILNYWKQPFTSKCQPLEAALTCIPPDQQPCSLPHSARRDYFKKKLIQEGGSFSWRKGGESIVGLFFSPDFDTFFCVHNMLIQNWSDFERFADAGRQCQELPWKMLICCQA